MYASIDRELLVSAGSDHLEAKAWDNFTLDKLTDLHGVSWVGAYDQPFAVGETPQSNFLVEIFPDVAGRPAAIPIFAEQLQGGDAGVDDANVSSELLPHVTHENGPVYQYNAMLGMKGIAAGDYWISITAMQTFPNASPIIDPTWQWHLGGIAESSDGFYSFDDTFDDAGDNGVGDNDQPPTPTFFHADKDLAFTLHGSEAVEFTGMLLAGESVTFMGTYFVTQADIDAGVITNEATVTADLPNTVRISGSDAFTWGISVPRIRYGYAFH